MCIITEVVNTTDMPSPKRNDGDAKLRIVKVNLTAVMNQLDLSNITTEQFHKSESK